MRYHLSPRLWIKLINVTWKSVCLSLSHGTWTPLHWHILPLSVIYEILFILSSHEFNTILNFPYIVFHVFLVQCLMQLSEIMSSLQKDWPSLSCPSSNGYRFWSHEWEKHGTCSESELDQREYFEAALKLKEKVNLLQILKKAEIVPDDGFYSLDSVVEAIKEAVGFTPGIECNKDSAGHSQIYQIFLCVDTSGSEIIECPVLPKGRCASNVQFAKF